MAEIAEIKDSGRGREWLASRDMKKGEQVVLTAPLAAVLRVEHMSTHCGRCFIPLSTSHDGGPGKTPEVCEGCSFFTVCHECAQADVNCDGQGGACEGVFAVHRECGECFVLQEGDMLDTTTRMLLRLEHARRREKPPVPGQQSGTGTSSGMLKALSGLRGLDLLEQHSDQKSDETLRSYADYVRLVLDRYHAVNEEGMDVTSAPGDDTPEKHSDDVVKRHVGWLQAIQHNQHAITDDTVTGDMIGNMVTTEGSMFNHSCRPCVTWCMLPSGKVQFVCSKDVPKGKPLCIPYVPEHTPKHLRIETLKEKWMFDCECDRCSEGENKPGGLGDDDARLVQGTEGLNEEWLSRDLGEELEEWLNAFIAQKGVSGVSGAEAVEMTRKLYSQGKGGKLADSHWSILRLSVSAGNILSALGEFDEAAKHYKRVIDNSPDVSCHSCSHHIGVKLAQALHGSNEMSAEAEKMAGKVLGEAVSEIVGLFGREHWSCKATEHALATVGRGAKRGNGVECGEGGNEPDAKKQKTVEVA